MNVHAPTTQKKKTGWNQACHVQHVWVGAHAIMFLLPAKERS